MSNIEWQTTLGYAEDSAISTRKPILFYYFDNNCIGCANMEAESFTDNEVCKLINQHMIAVQTNIDTKEVYDQYNAIWTPAVIILDYHGHEIQKTLGYLSKDELLSILHLGIAKVYSTVGEFDAANVHFKRLMERYPQSSCIPEAIYFQGVNRYRQKNEPQELRLAYETLLENNPGSNWTGRARVYSTL